MNIFSKEEIKNLKARADKLRQELLPLEALINTIDNKETRFEDLIVKAREAGYIIDVRVKKCAQEKKG